MSGPWQTTKVKPTSSVLHLETLLAGMPATVGRSLLCCSQRRGRHGIGDLKDRKTADRRCACCTLLSSRAPGWQKQCELTLWKVAKKKKKEKEKKYPNAICHPQTTSGRNTSKSIGSTLHSLSNYTLFIFTEGHHKKQPKTQLTRLSYRHFWRHVPLHH